MSSEGILRAMARSYENGHSWDHLDGEACIKVADEIAELKRQLEEAKDSEALAISARSQFKKMLHKQAETISGLEKQLAESQAREARLREALENHSGNYKLSKTECAVMNELLDRLHDDTALKEYLDAEAKFADVRFQKLFDDYSKVKTELEAARGVLGQFQYYRDGRSVRCAPPECDVLAACKKAP